MNNQLSKRTFNFDVPHDILHITPYAYDNDLLLTVNRAGIVNYTDRDFDIGRDGSYRYSVIHCIIHGRGTVLFRNKKYNIKEGQLFVLPSGEAHEYYTDPASPLGMCWIEFYGSNSKDIIRQIVDKSIVYEGAVFDTVVSLCTQVIIRLDMKEQFSEISNLLYRMLTELLKPSEYLNYLDAHRTGFAEVLNYIDSNLNKKLSIQMLAEQFGYNTSYFARKFAADFGITPARYILQRRIMMTQKLLLRTNQSMESIAAAVGFYDASHLIAKFKASEGITPLTYRKQNNGLSSIK